MTILVTGTGLIGVHTVRALIDEYKESVVVFGTMTNRAHVNEFCGGATLVQGDILNLPELIAAMRDHKVDAVVHSAGYVTDPAYTRPYAAVETNIMGTANVIEAASVAGAKRVVMVSSAVAAHMPGEGPNNNLAVPARIFAVTRLATEQIGNQYAALRGVRFISIRFAALYGPTIRGSNGTAARIKDAVDLAARGEPIVVKARSDAKAGKLYVKDAARSVALVVKHKQIPEDWEHVTVWAEGETFGKVGEILGELTGLPVRLEGQDLMRPASAPATDEAAQAAAHDSSRAYTLGYEARYDLRAGLTDYLAWARDYLARTS